MDGKTPAGSHHRERPVLTHDVMDGGEMVDAPIGLGPIAVVPKPPPVPQADGIEGHRRRRAEPKVPIQRSGSGFVGLRRSGGPAIAQVPAADIGNLAEFAVLY